MAERSALTEITQIGIEAGGAPGTAVAATKRLQALAIMLNPEVESDEFKPRGYKFPTIVTPTKEWCAGDLEGRLTYNEFQYPLALAVNSPVIVGAAGVFTWTFTPSSTAPDTVKTATIENGSAVRAHRAAGLVLPELSYTIDRDNGTEVGGTALALRLEDGITLSPGAVEVNNLAPVLVGETSLFMDALFANIGTTKLLRCKTVEWSLGGRFGPVWAIDASQPSYVGTVETEPSCQLTVTMQADAQGMGLLPVLRAGDVRYFRVEANGGPIGGTGTNRRFRHDMALEVADVGDFSEEDGVTSIDWTFDVVHNTAMGMAQTFELRNGQAAL